MTRHLSHGKVILWWGFPVKLVSHLCDMFGNSYWDVETLYTPTPEFMTIAVEKAPIREPRRGQRKKE
jgi:hypothetical protein